MTKIKIAYSGYDVISTEHEVENVKDFAKFLVNKVPTLDDAKKYVTAFGFGRLEHIQKVQELVIMRYCSYT